MNAPLYLIKKLIYTKEPDPIQDLVLLFDSHVSINHVIFHIIKKVSQ